MISSLRFMKAVDLMAHSLQSSWVREWLLIRPKSTPQTAATVRSMIFSGLVSREKYPTRRSFACSQASWREKAVLPAEGYPPSTMKSPNSVRKVLSILGSPQGISLAGSLCRS